MAGVVDIAVLCCAVLQGMKNPLDNVSQVTPKHSKPEDKAHKSVTGMYQYFLKVGALDKLHLVWASTCSAGVVNSISEQHHSTRGALGAMLSCGLLKGVKEGCRLSAAPLLCARVGAVVLVLPCYVYR